jgi:hypothetical protein
MEKEYFKRKEQKERGRSEDMKMKSLRDRILMETGAVRMLAAGNRIPQTGQHGQNRERLGQALSDRAKLLETLHKLPFGLG